MIPAVARRALRAIGSRSYLGGLLSPSEASVALALGVAGCRVPSRLGPARYGRLGFPACGEKDAAGSLND
ncbi:hypothetical protein NHX12_028968 [Muraenolepis orangiensis]|uniref:Uncharacterized protein n=1 Tax=Muraenolepis orangiensis TaxID=630683 RepID=A0A9Q0IKS1_9TELE|nr:hypothetical protein NHX12_028968 [Muraenolepis orangiensis]